LKCEVMSLPDLVQAKKTQLDKDWPMIRRLLEAHFFAGRARPTAARLRFWLLELRTAQLLVEVAQAHQQTARRLAPRRPLLRHALARNLVEVERALEEEEARVRTEDKAYWRPLLAELEELRHPPRTA